MFGFSSHPMNYCKDCNKRPKVDRQSRCSDCLRDHRRGRKEPVPSLYTDWDSPKPLQVSTKPRKVKVEPLLTEESLLKEIVAKHEAHTSLSLSRKGKYRLQVHCDPCLTVEGESLDDIFNLAMRNE